MNQIPGSSQTLGWHGSESVFPTEIKHQESRVSPELLAAYKTWLLTAPTQPQSSLTEELPIRTGTLPFLHLGVSFPNTNSPKCSICSTFIGRLWQGIWEPENRQPARTAGPTFWLPFAGRDSPLTGHPRTPTGQSCTWLNALFVFGQRLVPVKSD